MKISFIRTIFLFTGFSSFIACSERKEEDRHNTMPEPEPKSANEPSQVVVPLVTRMPPIRTQGDDFVRIKEATESLKSGDVKKINGALALLQRKIHPQIKGDKAIWPTEELVLFLVNTVMKNGSAEERQIVDELLGALAAIVEGADEDQSAQAAQVIVGMTQVAFESASASGPGSIPPGKPRSALEWWKTSRVHRLLLSGQ